MIKIKRLSDRAVVVFMGIQKKNNTLSSLPHRAWATCPRCMYLLADFCMYMPVFFNDKHSAARTCVRSFRSQVSLNDITSIIISIILTQSTLITRSKYAFFLSLQDRRSILCLLTFYPDISNTRFRQLYIFFLNLLFSLNFHIT